MTTAQLRTQLSHALTAYDRRQSSRRGYNPYALAHYFGALHEALAEIETGTTVRATLVGHFCGRLLDVALRAAGEPPSTDAEQRM
jgi:hypothetical protein